MKCKPLTIYFISLLVSSLSLEGTTWFGTGQHVSIGKNTSGSFTEIQFDDAGNTMKFREVVPGYYASEMVEEWAKGDNYFNSKNDFYVMFKDGEVRNIQENIGSQFIGIAKWMTSGSEEKVGYFYIGDIDVRFKARPADGEYKGTIFYSRVENGNVTDGHAEISATVKNGNLDEKSLTFTTPEGETMDFQGLRAYDFAIYGTDSNKIEIAGTYTKQMPAKKAYLTGVYFLKKGR